MTDVRRFRLDDLRRFASALAAGLGVPPARASSLATHLLWFDTAGASEFGIGSLPGWLRRIEARVIDPTAEGVVTLERSGTAVLDGDQGIPLLVLDRAAGIATEKARDVGLGLVRVSNLAPPGSLAGVAAEAAIGPVAVAILGPGPGWTVALPTSEGLPAIYDSALNGGLSSASLAVPAGLVPWASALVPEGGWLVAALSISATESLSSFHSRAGIALSGLDEGPGRLAPSPWEARRREARTLGVVVTDETWETLTDWADRLGVARPEPFSGTNVRSS